MSKLAVFIAAPAVVAAAALVVVNLELADRIDELERRVVDVEAVSSAPVPGPAPTVGRASRSGEARVRALEDRMTRVELRPMADAEVAVTSDAGSAPAIAAAAPAPDRADVERAVVSVLEAREAEKRLERREKMAARGAERLLRGVEVSDEQRGAVGGLVADHLRRMGEMRAQGLEPELAGQRAQELREEFRRGLEGVLDAMQMEVVGSRIERRFGEEPRRDADRRKGRRGGRRRRQRPPGDG